MTSIGDNIRKYRRKKNLTQKQLGELLELFNTYLSDIENNRTNPSIKTLKKLAKAMEISYILLLEDTE
ncbi:helix-turn-helix transcriptional regulator [Proteiniclasticum sp.]|uniref:helix-turn-helix domain-containing protein n=1 Tax=Proteiniclasticum sp. TaxID=2053595 RepID=UPI002898F0A1|nr:helix-turn-helix transcriptional regulator [Proteiniclasticum sp.]